ncbi:DUF922 domain-containing protein [Solirubrum puertoriconensis]|uniref:DUF922 domain-containing protein n=1 Tax=Solirubrum puertoriconensis TaxID=1751427 RepID=A0A9X0HM00_SOLP1|nr:DUF922 domain-containing protein [Solirubrum puertoriconensis]KUG08410.1 hypothetical protein ASU33_09595 [Solirubrum puertoriconensis]
MLDLLLFPLLLRSFLALPFTAPAQQQVAPKPAVQQQQPAAQAKPELLAWSAKRPLTWADFKARPNTADPLHALTTANIGAQIGCKDYVFSANVQATFTPTESWVKAPQTASAALLHHEQVHFDLTEVHARMLRQRLQTIKFDCERLQPAFNNLMKVAITAWQREQQRYDVETNHGLNLVKQKAWHEQVQQRLTQLQAFAAPEATAQNTGY